MPRRTRSSERPEAHAGGDVELDAHGFTAPEDAGEMPPPVIEQEATPAESTAELVPMAVLAEVTARPRKRSLGLSFWLPASWILLIFLAAVLAPVLPINDPE